MKRIREWTNGLMFVLGLWLVMGALLISGCGEGGDSSAIAAPASQPPPPNLLSLVARIEALEAKNVLKLEPYVSVNTNPVNGLNGPHIIFKGANIHVVSGSGATNDTCVNFPCGAGTLTGLGNLLVGYNELDPQNPLAPGDRGGSHNLIVGPSHRYSVYGGFVAGLKNEVKAAHASISGGERNLAANFGASVTGGTQNDATGFESTVTGGNANTASGEFAAVSGGVSHTAPGQHNWAAGALLQPQ